MSNSEYRIPHENMGSFQAKFEKLQNKVLKLRKKGIDCADVSFQEVRIELGKDEMGGPDHIFHVVTISGPTPQINGWTFVATLQHTDEGTIVGKIPTVEIPEGFLNKYRDAAPVCQHCNMNRKRNDTYVLRSDNAEIQVGSSCLGDFVHCSSPDSVAALAEILVQFSSCAEESECGGGCGTQGVSLEQYLPYVCCSIRKDGWLSRTVARDRNMPCATADLSWNCGIMASPENKNRFQPEPQDYDEAQKVLAHATEKLENTADLSDYEHNLHVVIKHGVVEFRTAGIAASLVVYVQKDIQRKLEFAKAADSKYIGAPKDKMTFENLIVLRVVDIDTQFGTSHLHIFQDTNGNRLTWKASNDRITQGNKVTLKGTIKEHKEYQGIKQTVLTRCKRIEAE
jgi:hypothetical protein